MNEIIDNNFINNYNKIELALKNAAFIAIDAEFSGIKEESVADLSLFDSMPQRYKKLRDNIDPFIAIQLGISAFKYIRDENKYKVETYNFYLLPRQLPFDDRQFMWQVGALEFLTRHHFDFNKLNYDGISYLDEEKEKKLRDSLKENDYVNNHAIFTNLSDETIFSTAIDSVAKWVKDTKSIEKSIELNCNNIAQQCYIQRELRSVFKSIWTESKGRTEIVVIKVDAETRQALEEADNGSLEKRIIDYFLGFTKVFKLLVALKKPIIGHNVLLDLMFIYKQFYRPLPQHYLDFKKEINRIFPNIYDTKFISYELKKKLNSDVLKSNILQELYEFFITTGRVLIIDSPKIEFETENTDEEKYHDAGWDSYYSGYCFVKTAYVHAIKKRGLRDGLIELTNSEIFYGVHEYVNCVNVIRADLSHIRLDGPDPKSTRPPWLNIKTQKISINIREISELLSPFGSIAIKPYNKKSILVATSNYRTAREILDHFQRSKDYRVALYNPLRYSLITKSIIWSSVVLSSGLLTWFIHAKIIKS